MAGVIDWEAQPERMTTRQVANLLGKSPGNVRARASKGDFGATTPGPDGLPRYNRERVRPIYERMVAREAQVRNSNLPQTASEQPLSVASLMITVQEQSAEQIALCKAWVEEARQAAQQAKEEAQELRALLREREETTRETLTHMDMLHDQSIRQARETAERERTHWADQMAVRDAEIERLKSELPTRKNGASPWRK